MVCNAAVVFIGETMNMMELIVTVAHEDAQAKAQWERSRMVTID